MKPFIMVKPDGKRYLNQLVAFLDASRISIVQIYFVGDWETLARALYGPELLLRGFKFETHAWLTRYLFGNWALILILNIPSDSGELSGFADSIQQVRDGFRSELAESKNGSFAIALNLNNLPPDMLTSNTGMAGDLGVLSSDGTFQPLSISTASGMWQYHYLNYIHAPDDIIHLEREWTILEDLGVLSDHNKISSERWTTMKLGNCILPPVNFYTNND